MKLSYGVNTDFQDIKYKDLTEKIIKVFYKVYNRLGYGFLEKVYENAMMIEFKKEGIPAVSQSAISVAICVDPCPINLKSGEEFNGREQSTVIKLSKGN